MKLLPVILGVLVLSSALDARQSPQIRITMQVPRVGFLGLAGSTSPNSQQVRVRVTRNVPSVQLLARSNSAYRIVVSPPDALSGKVRIGPVSVSPNAGSGHLAPEAMLARTVDNLTLEGPRISSGGNNGTPDNAVLITVPVEFLGGVEEADLTFQMDLSN